MNNFYVYEHVRPDTGEVFYVGKGSGRRIRSVKRINRHHQIIVAHIESLGLSISVRCVEANLSEAEAFTLERQRISLLRAAWVRLTNTTEGGEGTCGFPANKGVPKSDEHKKKLSEAAKRQLNRNLSGLQRSVAASVGTPRSDEVKAAISAGNKGKVRSPEFCKAVGDRSRGRTASDETRQKMSISRTGVKRPPMTKEQKEKISQAIRASWASGTYALREPSGAAKGGVPRSEAHCQAISEGVQRAWDRGAYNERISS